MWTRRGSPSEGLEIARSLREDGNKIKADKEKTKDSRWLTGHRRSSFFEEFRASIAKLADIYCPSPRFGAKH